jgi:glycerol-3-phosphate dehydrogenase
MKIGIVGGGINGLCVASEALKKGHDVTLFERGSLMSETSANSSKLLHGGLRYLENFEFRLVRESLKERKYWLNKSSELTHPLRFYLPVYKTSRRPAWMVRAGLYLYDILAGKHTIQKHRKEDIGQFSQQFPEFNKANLLAVYSYSDGQMDDKNLGLMLADELRSNGCTILENSPVVRLQKDGIIELKSGERYQFDKVVNVAGPWTEVLLQQSNISCETRLDLIRGSHIVVNRSLESGFILEVPNEDRVFFVLPHHGKTLVGTTEVRQGVDEPIQASQEEMDYLLKAYRHYFDNGVSEADIVDNYAGLRPLLISHKNPNKVSREYVMEKSGKVISVFGGKWTTSRALGEKLARKYL